MSRLIDEIGFHELPPEVRRIANEARIHFNRHGEHQATVRAYYPSSTIASIPVQRWMDDIETKRLIVETMILAVRSGATTVGLVSEIWMAPSKLDDKKFLRKAIAGKLHTMDNREEGLMVTCDTAVMSYLCVAKITQKSKKRELAKWQCTATSLQELTADTIEANRRTGEDLTPRFQNIWKKSRDRGKLFLEQLIEADPIAAMLFKVLTHA